MPQLKDRQRNAIQALTLRQLEALSMAALGKSPRARWNGRDGARSNMGGASNRMVDTLGELGLLKHHGSGITWAGVEGVLLNIGRVPELVRAEVRQAAELLRPKLAEEEDAAAVAAERARQERAAQAGVRKERREAAILDRLPKLASEHGLVISDDSGREEPFRGQLLAFWEAVVNADNVL